MISQKYVFLSAKKKVPPIRIHIHSFLYLSPCIDEGGFSYSVRVDGPVS